MAVNVFECVCSGEGELIGSDTDYAAVFGVERYDPGDSIAFDVVVDP